MIKISSNFVVDGPIDNKSALVKIMSLRWTINYPFPEPMMTNVSDAIWRHHATEI